MIRGIKFPKITFANVLELAFNAVIFLLTIYIASSFFSHFGPKPAFSVTLDERIKILTKSLNDASSSITDIEKEVEKRQVLVQRLKNDAEIAQQLKGIGDKQVQAISQALRGQLDAEAHASFWYGLLKDVCFTLLGVVLGEVVRFFRERISIWRATTPQPQLPDAPC